MVFLIPNTKSLWVKQAKGLKCDRTTIHELEDQFVTSASEIGDKQYLTLRVLWVRRTTLDCPAPFKDREARWKEALSFLTENEAWQQYWKDFRATSIDIKTPGALSIVRFYQKASYRDPEAIVTNRELRQLRKKVSPISRRQAYWSKSDDSDSQGDDGDPQDNDSDSQEDDSDPEDVKDKVSTTGKMTVGGPYTPIISSRAFVASPHTPATHALSSPAEDEAIVNTAFLLFLQGLCIWHPRLFLADNDIPQWTMKRLELIFNLGEEGGGNPKKGSLKVEMNPKERQKGEKRGSVKKKRGWKARTDGFLRLRDKAVIIIEVKPHLRATRPSDIQKQEGAQMAAWIRACPEDHYECEEKGRKIRRRLLFSQDSHEIYITIGEYGERYEEYLRTSKPTKEEKKAEPSFLTMYQYGPWDVLKEDKMRNVAILILACTLGEIPEDEGSVVNSFLIDPFLDREDDKGEGSGKGKGLPGVLERLSM